MLVLALGLTVGGLAMTVSPDQPGQPRSVGVGLIVALTLLTIAWVVILFNRLQLLVESVSRAWTLIDVQLQRRHDLVPALARVVAAHAAHEQDVLTRVAAARRWEAGTAEQAAQLSGEAAEQTTALNQIVAVSEGHPELEADAAFLELQHALADAEARIAASRTFFNDTVTLLHDRTRTFPGVLFARWLQLPYHELISAKGFERTVPAVHHTFA
jgi:LemA protein